MSSIVKQTVSRLAKTKKPLSDMHQLQRAVMELQKESADQLMLEVESQATFEYLTSQIKALKSAFETLSEVLMNEIDTLRKETHRRIGDIDAEVTRQHELQKATNTEVSQLKRTIEIWSMKERDWAKDNEILKASHTHNVEWMQQLQRDVMDTKDKVHEMRQDVVHRITSICEETNSFRSQWQKHADDMTERLVGFDDLVQKTIRESRAQAQQRLEDLEVMDQALGSMQKQQLQVQSSCDDKLQVFAKDSTLFGKKIELLESQSGQFHISMEQLKHKCSQLEKEQRKRMESINKMFTIFSDALHLSGPLGTIDRVN